jgi:hypothetical protein
VKESKMRLKETKMNTEHGRLPIDRKFRLKLNERFGTNLSDNYVSNYSGKHLLARVVGFEKDFGSKEEIVQAVEKWLAENAFFDDDFFWFVIDGQIFSQGYENDKKWVF